MVMEERYVFEQAKVETLRVVEYGLGKTTLSYITERTCFYAGSFSYSRCSIRLDPIKRYPPCLY